MSAHTPGPWSSAQPAGGFSSLKDSDGELVFAIAYPSLGMGDKARSSGGCDANLALIAAAPELLEALKGVLDHVEDTDAERIGNQCTLCFTYRTKIRAAIAKAEGRA